MNTQFLTLNLNYYPIFLKNITNYPSDPITYTVISGGNSLSYKKYIQVINKLVKISITSKI